MNEELEKQAGKRQRPFDQVEVQYRYVMDDLKKYLDRVEAERRADKDKPEHGSDKESPAMQRYKEHEKALSGKVQEHIKSGQNLAKEQEKGYVR